MSTHGVPLHHLSLRAEGMHCTGCEHIIEESVRELAGVSRVEADYPTEMVAIVFDPSRTDAAAICATIAQKGYRCAPADAAKTQPCWQKRLAFLLLGIAGILVIILLDTKFIDVQGVPDVSRHMGYGLILLLGLLTGFHCVGMCGGFVLTYSAAAAAAGESAIRSHASYGLGKTLSYTGIGALFGLVGAIVTFTPLLRGVAGVLAGFFLIAFGLNMLGLLAPLRRIRLKQPVSLALFVGRQEKRNVGRPFMVGLLNGLNIACGPLQAMYVMAAGTGSALTGTAMLFTFGIGTLPVLLTFGLLTTLISASSTHRLLKASGVILVLLGAVMINRGLILTGTGHDLQSMIAAWSRPDRKLAETPAAPAPEPAAEQRITMNVTAEGFEPSHFVLRAGVPVRWVIEGREITNCNRRIVVPSLGLEFDVKVGRQVVLFTPREAGMIPWSCWMGMMQGRFDVIEGTATDATIIARPVPVAPAAPMPQAAATELVFRPVARETDDMVPAAPPPQTVQSEATAPQAAEGQETYRIRAGDTLSGIAAKLYGDPRDWRRILAANPGLEPRRLRPGGLLVLPRPADRS